MKSSTFVQDDDDHDKSIPAPAPCHTPSYDIYNPPDTHQIVDDDARCAEMTLRPNNKRTVDESLVPKRLMGTEWRGEQDSTSLRAKTQRELE